MSNDTGKAMTLEQVLIKATCDWGSVEEHEVRLDHIAFLAERIRTHLATRVKVTDEDVERACAAWHEEDDWADYSPWPDGFRKDMRAALESFAASLPVISKDKDNDA